MLLEVLAGGAPAAPATSPGILALEAMPTNHCLQSPYACQSCELSLLPTFLC